MPIYEYRCEACQNVFEVLIRPGTAGDKVHCGKCGSDKVSKLISAGSFLKSSGDSLPNAGPSGGSGCGHRGFS